MADIRIGTSGWHYDDWQGPFYPPGLSADEQLPYYARTFRSAEINNTFYQLPSVDTVEAWRAAVPEGFLFAVKASRYTTHLKKLKDPVPSTERFLEVIVRLRDTLGPILFQLPPSWRANPGRLRDFLLAMPAQHRYAVELRDESWWSDAVHEVLREANAALVAFDLAGRQSPIEQTADFAYVRLHGPGDAYQGRYDDAALEAWAKRLTAWRAEGIDAFCYFDNDQKGYAVENARRLQELVGDG